MSSYSSGNTFYCFPNNTFDSFVGKQYVIPYVISLYSVPAFFILKKQRVFWHFSELSELKEISPEKKLFVSVEDFQLFFFSLYAKRMKRKMENSIKEASYAEMKFLFQWKIIFPPISKQLYYFSFQ